MSVKDLAESSVQWQRVGLSIARAEAAVQRAQHKRRPSAPARPTFHGLGG